jgi:hypothetical protein
MVACGNVSSQVTAAQSTAFESTNSSPSTPTRSVEASGPLFPTLAACQKITCTLLDSLDGVQTKRGILRVEVIASTAPSEESPDVINRVTHIAMWDRTGRLVYLTPKPIPLSDYAPKLSESDYDVSSSGLATDRSGRVFVPFAEGTHSSRVVVLDPNTDPVEDFDSVYYMADGPWPFHGDYGGTTVDIDGDGLLEIVVVDLLYESDDTAYPDAIRYANYLRYDGRSWQLAGCLKLGADSTTTAGPNLELGDPNCPIPHKE